jgi:hypothetical protein
VSESDNKPIKELSSAQRKAIPHMLAARTMEDAAKAAGVSVRTLQRWHSEPLFYATLAAAETDAIDYSVRQLILLSDKAVESLKVVLEDEAANPATKIRASLGVLDSLIKLRELRNLEARLSALERAYAEQL